ncbi:MAG: MFS transporter, partial [Alcanivorax sp.]|nr:MFS transporter [Alcanivorax sp.]
MRALARLSPEVRQYLIVTGNYWAFTLTDGALRMLVVLHFHTLGYTPLQIAALFLFYEVFGVVTNLVGGYLGARLGLNRTMNLGLAVQVVALLMLTVPAAGLTVPWVMGAQALSGIAKDLNKMSAKSSIKLLVPDSQQGTLYKWIAILTGSKNALKGVGFFLGGALLTLLGFAGAVLAMAAVLAVIWISSLVLLKKDLGKAKAKPKFKDILSKSQAINVLSAARLFLFGARDVWFVIALPVYLSTVFGWNF